MGAKWNEKLLGIASYAIGDVVTAAVGVFLIIKSRDIADYWFKNEDE